MLTVTAIILFEADGDPKRSKDGVPSLECNSLTRLKDTADQEEFEPMLESGKRGREGGNGGTLGQCVCQSVPGG